MPWPIPAPATIAGNAAAIYEATFPGIDARSANSVAAANTRIVGLTGYDLYLNQGYLAQQLFANTATDDLYLHANIWGVPQLQPTASTGAGAATAGGQQVTIPAGALATAPGSNAVYMTTVAVRVPANGSASVPLISALSGSAANLPAGTTLTLVSPIAGLAVQALVLDANGMANGTDIEPVASWQARILLKIRQPPQGGATVDYEEWATAAGAAYVNVVPNATGPGSVGVLIASAGPVGPVAATPQLVSAVQLYIDARRPVTANVLVGAATLVPVPVTVALNPNTTAIQAAAQNALQLFFQQAAQIGATLYVSRLDNALSSGDGEYSHERGLPAADVVFTGTQLGVLGTVTWTGS